MGQTLTSILLHVVFSTKGRKPIIGGHQDEMWQYMGGIAKAHKIKPVIIGGMDDHVHLLLEMPTDIALAKAMQFIKGGSSKWFNEKYKANFQWQQGYSAFSVSRSLQKKVVAYIRDQAIHHKKRDFKEELLAFLKVHEIEYDPKYIFE
jgi:putative transposase